MVNSETRARQRKHLLVAAVPVVLAIAIVVLTYLLPGRGPETVALPHLVRSNGVYLSGDSDRKLLVENTEAGNLRVTLQNAADSKVLITGTFGGIYQSWFVYWDRRDRVWIHTSDLQSSPWVWTKDSAGGFSQMEVISSPLRNAVPSAVYENLPASRQKLIEGQ